MQRHAHRQKISFLVHRHNYFLFEEQVSETFYDRIDLHPIEEYVVKAIADIWEFLNGWLANWDAIIICFSFVFERRIYLENYAVNMSFKCIFETFFIVHSDVKIFQNLLKNVKERILGGYTKCFWHPKACTVLCFILYEGFIIFYQEVLFILGTLQRFFHITYLLL